MATMEEQDMTVLTDNMTFGTFMANLANTSWTHVRN